MPIHNSDEGKLIYSNFSLTEKCNIEMRPGESHGREQQHALKYKFAQRTRNWLLLPTVR